MPGPTTRLHAAGTFVTDTPGRRRGALLAWRRPVPVRTIVACLASVVVSMAAASSAAASGNTLAWGLNTVGQLGNGTTTNAFAPVQASLPSGVTVTQVAAGEGDSLALLSNGTVLAWGENGVGELGDASTTNSLVPVVVCEKGASSCTSTTNELTGVEEVAAVGSVSFARRNGGELVAWGANFGLFGNGTDTPFSDTPVEVRLPHTVEQVSAAEEHVLARLKNGEVYEWEVEASPYEPQKVAGIAGKVRSVAAGRGLSLAVLETTGEVLAWRGGNNALGELGNGTNEEGSGKPAPVCAPGQTFPCAQPLEQVKSVAAGEDYGLALLNTGKVVAWGVDEYGQLGDGAPSGPGHECNLGGGKAALCSVVPVEVLLNLPADVTVSAVSANGAASHNLALLSTGRVLSWGIDDHGELGTGEIGPLLTCGGKAFGGEQACSTFPLPVCPVKAVGVGREPCPSGPYLNGVTGAAVGYDHGLAVRETYPTVASAGPYSGQVEVIPPIGTTASNLTSSAPPPTCPTHGTIAPVGALSYEVSNISPLSTIKVTLLLPPSPAITELWKVEPVTNNCTLVPIVSSGSPPSPPYAEVNGDEVTVTITDNGTGDFSSTPGTILDPIIPVSKGMEAQCTTNTGTIKLSPGLTNTASVQTMKIKGTLSGCTGQPFTTVAYSATLKTAAAVSCSVLKGAGETASGASSYKWTPKTKPSTATGTLRMLLSETPGVALSGTVAAGPHSPLTLSGKVSQTFTGGATCGTKAVKKGAFTGTTVAFE